MVAIPFDRRAIHIGPNIQCTCTLSFSSIYGSLLHPTALQSVKAHGNLLAIDTPKITYKINIHWVSKIYTPNLHTEGSKTMLHSLCYLVPCSGQQQQQQKEKIVINFQIFAPLFFHFDPHFLHVYTFPLKSA